MSCSTLMLIVPAENFDNFSLDLCHGSQCVGGVVESRTKRYAFKKSNPSWWILLIGIQKIPMLGQKCFL
jgi:hypothetical protein